MYPNEIILMNYILWYGCLLCYTATSSFLNTNFVSSDVSIINNAVGSILDHPVIFFFI